MANYTRIFQEGWDLACTSVMDPNGSGSLVSTLLHHADMYFHYPASGLNNPKDYNLANYNGTGVHSYPQFGGRDVDNFHPFALRGWSMMHTVCSNPEDPQNPSGLGDTKRANRTILIDNFAIHGNQAQSEGNYQIFHLSLIHI